MGQHSIRECVCGGGGVLEEQISLSLKGQKAQIGQYSLLADTLVYLTPTSGHTRAPSDEKSHLCFSAFRLMKEDLRWQGSLSPADRLNNSTSPDIGKSAQIPEQIFFDLCLRWPHLKHTC